MPQVEAGLLPEADSVIDLREVDQNRRTLMWNSAARDSWPGITVTLDSPLPSGGSIKRVPLGAGDLFEVESLAADVDFHPTQSSCTRNAFLSVMVQVEGATQVHQNGLQAVVEPGDICLLDESSRFRIVSQEWGRIYFLRLPRAQALGRHPLLQRLVAQTLSSSDTGTSLLTDLLLRLGKDAPKLGDAQRNAALGGVIQMLGLASLPEGKLSPTDWRIRRAIDFIEQNLQQQDLSPEAVARDQRISRRRLDAIMQQQLGRSISRQIWSRRLERASEDLRNPQGFHQPIAQIAFANGFENVAHFTRAFKNRYLITPGQWRLN
nr:helix-turn-helix domain-containing protein [Altererythrobacter sp. KTW20L]